MDYSYLNQGFEAAANSASCSLASMEAAGMPCAYGDLASCGQMGQAYRYSAAMRYNHPSPGQCAVMARGGPQDHHRAAAAAAAMFPTSMNLQCEYCKKQHFPSQTPACNVTVKLPLYQNNNKYCRMFVFVRAKFVCYFLNMFQNVQK
jgi:hypothetical protein